MKTRNKTRAEVKELWLKEERNLRAILYELDGCSDAPHLYSQEEWNNLKAQFDKSKERLQSWTALLNEYDVDSLRSHPGLDK